jgi:hypothetical protein
LQPRPVLRRSSYGVTHQRRIYRTIKVIDAKIRDLQGEVKLSRKDRRKKRRSNRKSRRMARKEKRRERRRARRGGSDDGGSDDDPMSMLAQFNVARRTTMLGRRERQEARKERRAARKEKRIERRAARKQKRQERKDARKKRRMDRRAGRKRNQMRKIRAYRKMKVDLLKQIPWRDQRTTRIKWLWRLGRVGCRTVRDLICEAIGLDCKPLTHWHARLVGLGSPLDPGTTYLFGHPIGSLSLMLISWHMCRSREED